MRMRKRIRVPALALCVGLFLAACGSDTRADSAITALREHIGTARTALAAGNERTAQDAMERFRAEVRRQAERGDLNDDDASVLRAQAQRIAADLERRAAEQERAAAEKRAAEEKRTAEAAKAAEAANAVRIAEELVPGLFGDDARGKRKKNKQNQGRDGDDDD